MVVKRKKTDAEYQQNPPKKKKKKKTVWLLENANRELILKIKKEDWENAVCGHPYKCVLSNTTRAVWPGVMKAMMKERHLKVWFYGHRQDGTIGHTCRRYKPTKEAVAAIKQYDNDKKWPQDVTELVFLPYPEDTRTPDQKAKRKAIDANRQPPKQHSYTPTWEGRKLFRATPPRLPKT
jgi:hypothetical protein